jgi:hypothetical protein
MDSKFLGLLVAVLGALPGQAQEILHVSSEPSCAGCTIRVEHLATLGRVEDPISPLWYARVAADSSGNLFVGPTTSPGEIAVYSSSGELLRTLGREGEGPGEFFGIRYVQILGGDSLHVLSRGRHTVLSLEGDVLGTSPALVYSTNATVLGDGRMLVNTAIQTPEKIGIPAHILGTDGQPALSFGNDSRDPQGEFVEGNWRTVSYSGGDRVWVGPLGEYRLEAWDTTGVHLKTLIRSAEWFQHWDRRSARQPFGEEPNPILLSAHEDARGRLWVISRVPDRNWKPGFKEPAYEEVYDTVLEVIDPLSGDLVASQRFDGEEHLFLYFISADLLTSFSVNDVGLERVHVWRFWLDNPPTEDTTQE